MQLAGHIHGYPRKELAMDSTLNIALAHQTAVQRRMDVVANNIANMNTTAFQKENVVFREFQIELQNANSPLGKTISLVQEVGSKRSFKEGIFLPTNNTLDLAISGPGYITVQNDEGELRYTRNGHLSLNEEGMLTAADNSLVLDDGGAPIAIGPNDTNIEIASDGTITSEAGPLGKIGLVEFTEDELVNLRKAGLSLYSSDNQPLPAEQSSITQGMLEGSNVNAIEEMTDMLTIMRSYQSVAKMMDNYQSLKNSSLKTLGAVG